MIRKIFVAIAYFVALLYVASIAWPAEYCLRHGCKGSDLDAFMPAFVLTPFGAIAAAFALRHSIQRIKSGSAIFWPLAILFAILLAAVAAFIAWIIYSMFRLRA